MSDKPLTIKLLLKYSHIQWYANIVSTLCHSTLIPWNTLDRYNPSSESRRSHTRDAHHGMSACRRDNDWQATDCPSAHNWSKPNDPCRTKYQSAFKVVTTLPIFDPVFLFISPLLHTSLENILISNNK